MSRAKKKKYVVEVREVWVQAVEVLASSPKEAIAVVADGGGQHLDNSLEYSHSLDPDLWSASEPDDK